LFSFHVSFGRCFSAGRDKGGYYNELFLRGKIILSHKIQRVKIKGNGPRKPSSPKTEPNFYEMPYVPDKEILNRKANEQLLVARQLASSRNFGGGLVSENKAVFDASLMHIASVRQAFPQAPRELLEGLGRFHRPSLPLVGNPNLETDLSVARHQANFSGAVLPGAGMPV